MPNRNASSSNSLNNPSSQTNQNGISNNNPNSNETDQNIDDHCSVVSDSAAWSTEMNNNSDSDFESNSPSKYTPYSTYSSNSSSIHPALNQSMLNDFVQSTQSLQNPYAPNSNLIPNNYSISYSSSASSAINILSVNNESNVI